MTTFTGNRWRIWAPVLLAIAGFGVFSVAFCAGFCCGGQERQAPMGQERCAFFTHGLALSGQTLAAGFLLLFAGFAFPAPISFPPSRFVSAIFRPPQTLS